MSNWTYISGSVSLERGPYEVKLNKDGCIKYYESGAYEGWAQLYLPYPEEQFRITETNPWLKKDGEKPKAGFRHKIEVTSYPIIKRDIEKLMKTLPSGESDEIFYMLKEDNALRGSSSSFNSPQTEKLFKQAVMEKFPLWKNCSWKEYEKYMPTEMDWEDSKDDAVLCINDAIRWCDANDFYLKLMDVFTSLIEKNYTLERGVFSFTDIFRYEYYIKINSGVITTTITDKETGDHRCEYFQVFQYRDLSDPDDRNKRYPMRSKLKKVDKVIDDFWPILEDYFPEEKEE